MDIQTIEAIKELALTLNLESQTTADIINQLMPILWWKFVWVPVIENVVFFVFVLVVMFGFYKLFKRTML